MHVEYDMKIIRCDKTNNNQQYVRVQVNWVFLEWVEVLVVSHKPQDWVPGPLLFLVFVRDLPEWVKQYYDIR